MYSKHGHWNGGKLTPTYRSWLAARKRCSNPNYHCTHRYIDKGITFSSEWDDFNTFLADMGERPEGTSLDRIDNSKGYFKGNCRWATPKQQGENRDLPKKYINNKSTITGVHWDINRNKWFAQLRRKGKTIPLGRYDNFLDACAARKSMEIKYDANFS